MCCENVLCAQVVAGSSCPSLSPFTDSLSLQMLSSSFAM